MQLGTKVSQQGQPALPGVPGHVAIIMDGNGRWAKQRGLPRLEGHRVGVERIQRILDTLSRRQVRYVTLYAFSTENWSRPETEVTGILEILHHALREQTAALHQNNVRLVHIGKIERLGPEIQKEVAWAQKMTQDNTGITLNVALDYGGREEILEAVRRIIRDGVKEEAVDEGLFRTYLFTHESPDPDLIIRTGGELRISNFLLWQSAYSEYYHTTTLWPDLDCDELERVLEEYSRRQRRFGRVDPEE